MMGQRLWISAMKMPLLPGKKMRENLTTMARSCSGVGSALVTIITMKCVYMLGQGNERTGFRWFALIVAVLFPLLRKFMSSIRVFYLSFGMAIAGYAILLVLMIGGHTVLGALVVPGFLIFAAFGMLTVLTTVFLANTVDYGEMKNHRRDESVIFSMQTFVVKLASGVAVLIAAICLSLCNLKQDTSAAVVARAVDSSVLGLRLTMAGIPMIGLFIAVLVFRKKSVPLRQMY